MVRDIELFRPEAGGNPDKMRENQIKRSKPTELVDTVINNDKNWRRSQFLLDNCNKIKNIVSKNIGARMKAKQPQGDTDVLPETFLVQDNQEINEEFVEKLATIKNEDLEPLCTKQVKWGAAQ